MTAAGRAGLMVIGVKHANGRRLQADLVISAFDDPRLASILGLPAWAAVP